MMKHSLFNKCLSLVLAITLLIGLASPASAAVSWTYGKEDYAGYVALGDAMTYGVGLDDIDDAYFVKVADALAKAGKITDEDDWYAHANAKYRIEEIRYLLDEDYEGDGYTDRISGLDLARDEVQSQVKNAKVITLNIGTNNFATYIVEQMMYYAEHGEAKHTYSFDEFAGAGMIDAVDSITAIVSEKLHAATETGGDVLDLIDFVTEVSVYTVLSYIYSFNATVDAIYALNPDVELYVVGLYNFCEGETLSLSVGGREADFNIGEVFGALVEIANIYIQIFGDRGARHYVYVDAGSPELLIDQMGDTSKTFEERIPDGLMAELMELAGPAAIDGIVEMFKEYGLDKDEDYAEDFLLDLVSFSTTEERMEFLEGELLGLAGELAYDEFVKQLNDKLGQFGEAKDFVTEAEIKQLLEDLENATNRYDVAYNFVITLINNEELKRQAAAKVIFDKLQAQDELNGYVTVENVEALLLSLDQVDANNYLTDAEYEAVLKSKIDAWVSTYLLLPRLDEIYADFTLPGYASISDFFADVETKADPDAFIREVTLSAVVNEIEADSRFTANAAILSALGLDIEAFFSNIDASLANNPAMTVEKAVRAELGIFAVEPLVNVLTEGYTKYDAAADSAVNAYYQYQDVKNEASNRILEAYIENYKNGELDLSGFADLQALCDEAATEIVNGYSEYEQKLDEAIDMAAAYNGDLDNAYLSLMSIAEIHTISLNAIVDVAKKVSGEGSSYVESVANSVVNNTLGTGEKTIAYLAVRYFLGNAMMVMPSADGHNQIAQNIIKAIETGKDVNSTVGGWGNKVIDGIIDLYRFSKAFIKSPDHASGQVGTIINPDHYVSLGDNITTGTALNGEKTYAELLADALAMEYEDVDDVDQDIIDLLAMNGLRTEDLLVLLSNSYNGDGYTDDRFGLDALKAERAKYQAAIADADLVTLQIGINNLVTYPMTQTLLAYNDKPVHEMAWNYYFGDSIANKLTNGKNIVMDLLLHVVDSVDNRVVEPATGRSAYDECRIALNTVSTLFESMAYGLVGYVAHLDSAVEAIGDLNANGTIVLLGFYNPLEDLTIKIDETVTIAGNSVDLSKYGIGLEYISEFMLEIADRHLTNYVGDHAGRETAADEYSRIVSVKINDAPLVIHDKVSCDLANMQGQATVTVRGHEVTFPIPEYFDGLFHTGSHALHPSAEGHQYICNEILKALKFQIHADVWPDDNWKYYGDEDPELTIVMDDKSSLYDDLVVELSREEGENVGFYDLYVTLKQNTGYYEVDVENLPNGFEIKAMPITIEVVNGATITVGDPIPEFTVVVKDIHGNVLSGVNVEITGIPADSNTAGEYEISAILNETNYVLAENGLTTATLKIEEPTECEHVWVDVNNYESHPAYVAPTCIQKGTMPTVCSKCGAESTRVIVPLGHDWQLVNAGVVPANCQETGIRPTYECSHCGATKGGETYKGNHDWSAWTVITEATCTQSGLKSRVCNVCGTKQVSTIAKIDHDVDAWTIVKEPTCTEDGLKEGYCKRCNQHVTVTIPRLGHQYEGVVQGVDPNCTEPGWRSGYCSRCGHEVYEVLNALGHSLDFDQYIHACQRDDCHFWEYHTLVTGEKYIECTCGYKCRVDLVIENITLDKYPDAMINKFGSVDNLLAYFNNAAENLNGDVKEENTVVVDVELIVEMLTDSGVGISTDKAQAGVHYDAESGYPVTLDVPAEIVGKADLFDIYIFHMHTIPNSAGEYEVEQIGNVTVDTQTNKISFNLHSFSPVMISWVCKGHYWSAWQVNGTKEVRTCSACGETEERNFVCWNTRTGVKYEIVHLAVLEAQAGDTIQMLTDSDQTQLTDKYDYAADVNLINGVSLDLQGYTLTVNSLFAAEGSYVTATAPTNATNGGKLIVPAENLVLNGAYASVETNKGDGYLPVWDAEHGYYLFSRIQVLNDKADRVLITTDDLISFKFDVNASKYVLDNLFAKTGVTDNRMSVEVYLEWELPGEGIAHQTFVFDDTLVGQATWTKSNGAAKESDLIFTLTNYAELGIDLSTLTISARVVSESGAIVEGVTFDAKGIVTKKDSTSATTAPNYNYESATGFVCENGTTHKQYAVLHDAIMEAKPGEEIVMIADSDQTALTGICPSAGMVNLSNGVKLNLGDHTLKLDCLVVGDGSYVTATAPTNATNGGKLIVPAENLVLNGAYASVETNKGDGYLPVWDAEHGYYLFSRIQVLNDKADRVLITTDDLISFKFDVNASKYVLDNLFAKTGVTDNRMSVEVYLEWELPGEGIAHQTFVFDDTLVGQATWTKSNGAAKESDLIFTLTNYAELGIDLSTLTISARVVSESGAIVQGVTYNAK